MKPAVANQPRVRKSLLVLLLAAFTWFLAELPSGALIDSIQMLMTRRRATQHKPVAAGVAQLSREEREHILALPPQQQAECLMRAAINHRIGATELIEGRLENWRGKIKETNEWSELDLAARYSSDFEVRAAAIEINLLIHNLRKDETTANLLHSAGEANPKVRAGNAYALGMLASRGVAPERIRGWLVDWAHDKSEETRFWAVEGLSLIGCDATVADLTKILRSDVSLKVRERAGTGLAESGMLTREQRLRAVPALVHMANDKRLDETTRAWVYQSLRQITGEPLPNQAAQWRKYSFARAKIQQAHVSQPVPARPKSAAGAIQ